VDEWLFPWSEVVSLGDVTATDIEWRPGSGKWYRPGPLMESRALGLWPSQGTYGVCSNAAWDAAEAPRETAFDPRELPQVGCDLAAFGDDYTATHERRPRSG
jgi:hypothetical protein